MINKQEVGKRIRDRRLELGLTVTEFSEILGISCEFVGMVERGKRFVTADKLIKFSDILGVSADYILKGAGEIRNLTSAKTKLLHLAETVTDEHEAELYMKLHLLLVRYACKPRDLNYIAKTAGTLLKHLNEKL